MNSKVFNLDSSSAAAKFWPELKELSDNDKLSLIVLLSSSMTHVAKEKPQEHEGWADRFCGAWKDSRSAEQIVDDIRKMRTSNNFDTAL